MLLGAKQQEFLINPLRKINVLSGVTGSGKSYVANLRWYDYICGRVPNGALLIQSGNISESLYDNVIGPLLEIDKGIGWLDYATFENRRRLFVKPKQIEIVCIGANDEKAQDRIHGKNVWGWYGDEITKQPKSFVEMCLSRCRAEVNGKLQTMPAIWTCNPDAPGHFVKREYIDRPERDVKNWAFDFHDNPIITEEFIRDQEARYTGVFYQRMIKGKWVAAEGAIYDKFLRQYHCIEVIPEKTIIEYVLGIDWGYEHPLAIILFGVDNDGTYYGLDEIYGQHIQVDEMLKAMIKAKGWFDLPFYRFNGIQYTRYSIKPSFAYADSNRPDLISQFQKLTGITTIPAIKDDKLSMIQSVQRKYVANKQGRYGIYYLGNKVPKLIEEKENYRWMNKKGEGTDEPMKVDDHTQDAEQYVIYTRERSKVRMAHVR